MSEEVEAAVIACHFARSEERNNHHLGRSVGRLELGRRLSRMENSKWSYAGAEKTGEEERG